MKMIICNCDYRDVITQLDGAIALVTDPPFNIGYKYRSYNDNMDDGEYYQMLSELVNSFDMSVIIHYPEALHRLSIMLGKPPTRVCSWVYNSNTPRQHRDVAFYGVNPDFKKRGQPYKNPNDKRIKKLIAQGKKARLYDWWNINQVKNTSSEKTPHPCQMPLDVMKNIIGCLPDGVTVFDPFTGSGTTALACKHLHVDFIGCEIDWDYYNIALERVTND